MGLKNCLNQVLCLSGGPSIPAGRWTEGDPGQSQDFPQKTALDKGAIQCPSVLGPSAAGLNPGCASQIDLGGLNNTEAQPPREF